MNLFLNIFYMIAIFFLSPILLYRIVAKGKYKNSLLERLGIAIPEKKRPCIWLHGVSVGEIKASQPLVFAIQKNFPDQEIIISSTSQAGKEIACQMYPELTVISFPFDFSWVVSSFLKRLQPSLIILMELELWPNFLNACTQKHIPVVLVNGRLSEKSFLGYRRYLRWYFPKMTRAIQAFCVQCDIYAQRFIQLGIEEDRIQITGNIKFDAVDTHLGHPSITRTSLGLEEDTQVIICGSTHSPEEKWLLEIWLNIRKKYPDKKLRWIIVPRHPARAEEISQWVKNIGLTPVCKTKIQPGYSMQYDDVMIVDTMGELKNLYWMSTIACIGGSFISHGGQNFIEPAGFGKAVLCGPYMQNFPDIRVFLEQKAVIQVKHYTEIETEILHLLQDKKLLEAMGQRAKNLVEKSTGSTEKCMEQLKKQMAKIR